MVLFESYFHHCYIHYFSYLTLFLSLQARVHLHFCYNKAITQFKITQYDCHLLSPVCGDNSQEGPGLMLLKKNIDWNRCYAFKKYWCFQLFSLCHHCCWSKKILKGTAILTTGIAPKGSICLEIPLRSLL